MDLSHVEGQEIQILMTNHNPLEFIVVLKGVIKGYTDDEEVLGVSDPDGDDGRGCGDYHHLLGALAEQAQDPGYEARVHHSETSSGSMASQRSSYPNRFEALGRKKALKASRGPPA